MAGLASELSSHYYNMNEEIIFIISSLSDSHCKHRILSFLQLGYRVKVYGFQRNGESVPENLPYEITVVGTVQDSQYRARIRTYLKGVSRIVRQEGNKKLYFTFGLDLTLFLRIVSPRCKYIYEEADLVHTYMKSWRKRVLERIDKGLIRRSQYTILTSEGFAQYHFGTNYPKNIQIVPNKLNADVLKIPFSKSPFDIHHLRFAFVGGARFDTIDFFVQTLLENFPQHEFHFYGTVEPRMERFKEQFTNVFYHGRFKNPDNLPSIYENIDLVLSTYDTGFDNVKYAEPNKLYEAIYFHTPIIVSNDTFLAQKVQKLGVGFVVNPFDSSAIIQFVQSITGQQLIQKQNACQMIPKTDCIN